VAIDWERERETLAGATGGEYWPTGRGRFEGMDGELDGDDDGEKVGNAEGDAGLDDGRSSRWEDSVRTNDEG
jgi:hypothetical protein